MSGSPFPLLLFDRAEERAHLSTYEALRIHPDQVHVRYKWVDALVFGCGAASEIQNHQCVNHNWGTALKKHTWSVITWALELPLPGTNLTSKGHTWLPLRAPVTWRWGTCIPSHREHLRVASSLLHEGDWMNTSNKVWGKEPVPFHLDKCFNSCAKCLGYLDEWININEHCQTDCIENYFRAQRFFGG